MARIPDEAITRIKQDVSLSRLVETAGITLKKHGKDLMGLCPFHNDKEPSLVITPDKNLWHCLGACQSGGSVIDWVMKKEGVSFRHAVELLQNDSFSSLAAKNENQSTASNPVKRSTVQKLPTSLESSVEDAKLLSQVIDYYHQTLKDSPEALAYLQKRGIGTAEAIDHFKLGFANRTLGYRLPMKNRKEGAAIRGQLQRLGLYRSSGHEHFTGSIVFPIINETGQVTEIYGRKINDNLRKGTPTHLYLPGAHAGIWNEAALKVSAEIILCESLIDALTFWCAGYRHVTASYGIEGFTADHTLAFKQNNIERVLIAYDRDEAGNNAAEKLAKQLIDSGIDCYRIQFPKGMDANEYAQQVQPASKSLGVAIRSAIWLGQGKAKPVTTANNAIEAIPVPVTKSSLQKPDTVSVSELKAETMPSLAADGQECTNAVGAGSTGTVKKETEQPLTATPVPEAPKPIINAEIKTLGDAEELIITLGDRRYRIRGLDKNLNYDQLKINLLVSRPSFDGAGQAVHVDTLDCYQSRPRSVFIKQAAIELGLKEDIIKHDLGKILLKLESLQEQRLKSLQEPKTKTISLSDEDTQAALALLKSPDLLNHIQNDFNRCGVVGENTNKLVGYLAVISRKLESPLAITIQSTSAAGKSALMDAVLAFMPDEERIKYSAMTGQSLFYMGETDLQHKVLAIVEEEGASNAAYALKLLQSEGELTIASTGKDPVTGELKTQDYQVKGPVMIMLTTTAIDIDEELLNRCIVLSVDEGRQQTRAIHAIQRNKRTLQGLLAKNDKQAIVTLHQNAQRLLQPLAVVNPYAQHLSFIDDRTRTRRDHEKYLTLIDSLALLHQHQRHIKTINHNNQPICYVEVSLDDIEIANKLAHETLGRTLDELPPQSRKLLKYIRKMVTQQCQAQELEQKDHRFSRRDIRVFTGWSDGQLKIHCRRLSELEYLLVHRGGRGQCIEYELLYDGSGDDQPHLMGLIDPKKLMYDVEKTGQKQQKTAPGPCQDSAKSGPSQCQDSAKSGPSQGAKNSHKAIKDETSGDLDKEITENALFQPNKGNGSYRNHSSVIMAKATD